MRKKIRMILSVSICVLVAVLLMNAAWAFSPSQGKSFFYVQESGITVEDTLTSEEVRVVKEVLWGKIKWPQWLYGYPACGFGKAFAIELDGTYYMPAWDSCGMIAVCGSDSEVIRYINVTQRQKAILEEMIVAQDMLN